MDELDPTVSNGDLYKVVFENERVRVLEYLDRPGDRTTPHAHPDSVMFTLSSFRRRLVSGEETRDVELPAGQAQLAARTAAQRGEHRRLRDARDLRRAQGAGPPAARIARPGGTAGITGSARSGHDS